jgi:hypothetical protein
MQRYEIIGQKWCKEGKYVLENETILIQVYEQSLTTITALREQLLNI